MKKIVAFLLMLSSFLWMFGCAEQTEPPINNDEKAPEQPEQEGPNTDDNPYQVRIFGTSDSALLGSFGAEFPLWKLEYFQAEDVPQEMEVVFDNVTYKGTYDKSWVRRYEYYPVHIYRVADPDVKFYVDANGTLLHLHRPYLESDFSLPQLTQEQCEEIALEFLSTVVENPEDYTMTSKKVDSYYVGYDVNFVRYIDSCKTADQFYFTIERTTGQIQYYNSYMLDRIDVDAVLPLDQATAEQAVIARLDEMFADTAFDRVEYRELEYILTKISPTEYAFVCEARLDCYKDGAKYGQLLMFVITE